MPFIRAAWRRILAVSTRMNSLELLLLFIFRIQIILQCLIKISVDTRPTAFEGGQLPFFLMAINSYNIVIKYFIRQTENLNPQEPTNILIRSSSSRQF